MEDLDDNFLKFECQSDMELSGTLNSAQRMHDQQYEQSDHEQEENVNFKHYLTLDWKKQI